MGTPVLILEDCAYQPNMSPYTLAALVVVAVLVKGVELAPSPRFKRAVPNGCDPATAIGAFLNFPKMRVWCASNDVTYFGPYGGVPSADGRPAPPNPPRPQSPVPQVLISIPQRPEEDSRDGEDYDYDNLDVREDSLLG